MQGTLLVTPSELTAKATSFSSQATQVKSLHDSMITKINSLSGSFTGNTAEAYISKFTALQKSMDTIYSMIQEHVNDLNQMAETYSASDDRAKAAVDDLPQSSL